MKLHDLAFLARVTPSGGGGGALSMVQNPNQTPIAASAIMQTDAFTAITSGNGLVVVVFAPTSGGAPAITDSAGNTWGPPIASYAGAGGTTTRVYALANITNGPTWVRATFAGDVNGFIAPIEAAGAGSSFAVDFAPVDGGAAQGATTDWDFAVTTTVDGALFVCTMHLTNGSLPIDVPPVDAHGTNDNYDIYGRGILATAGAQTPQIELTDSRSGDKFWVVIKAGA
jgi:hypothetical protein